MVSVRYFGIRPRHSAKTHRLLIGACRIRLTRMLKLLSFIRNWVMPRRVSAPSELTAVEYEAVCLIAYEGRAAYSRARQQAFYCRARGSEQGFRFWSAVAVEVDRRAGTSAKRADEQSK